MADGSVCTYLDAIKEDTNLNKYLLGVVIAIDNEDEFQGQFGSDFQQVTQYT